MIGIVQVFKYEKDEFQRRKYNNEINLKNTEINVVINTAKKISSWLNQTKPKEEPSKNQVLNLNLYDKQNQVPDLDLIDNIGNEEKLKTD